MRSIKELAGMFEVSDKCTLEIGDNTVVLNIKSLPVNFSDELDEILPYPKTPRKPNKKTHQFEDDPNDPKYKEERAKVERLRVYATVLMGLKEDVILVNGEEFVLEGDIYAKIDALLETRIPMGYWIDIAKQINELSGIKEEDFR